MTDSEKKDIHESIDTLSIVYDLLHQYDYKKLAFDVMEYYNNHETPSDKFEFTKVLIDFINSKLDTPIPKADSEIITKLISDSYSEFKKNQI